MNVQTRRELWNEDNDFAPTQIDGSANFGIEVPEEDTLPNTQPYTDWPSNVSPGPPLLGTSAQPREDSQRQPPPSPSLASSDDTSNILASLSPTPLAHSPAQPASNQDPQISDEPQILLPVVATGYGTVAAESDPSQEHTVPLTPLTPPSNARNELGASPSNITTPSAAHTEVFSAVSLGSEEEPNRETTTAATGSRI